MQEEDNKKLTKKKKKYVYNPYKISAIIIVGLIVLIFILELYDKSLNQYLVLTCRLNSEDTHLNETIRYYYTIDDNNMNKFYLDQIYTYEDSDEYNSIYNYLVDYKKELGDFLNTDTLSYVIKKESDTKISVKTFINVKLADSIFDSYMTQIGVTHEDTIEEVYNTYVANSVYTCTVTEAK